MAVKDLLSDTLMVSGVKWCPVIDEVLYATASTQRDGLRVIPILHAGGRASQTSLSRKTKRVGAQ